MAIKCILDHYYVSRLDHPGKIGSIYLPDHSKEAFYDATVEASGPGRYDRKGKWWSQQAEVGDRIICDPSCFDTLEGRKGFVSDRNLLGIIRQPDFRAVEPAGPWLLIEPDPREDYKQTESGLLVAHPALAGAEEREKQRGYEITQKYESLLRSEKYRSEPTDYDKWKLEEEFFKSLSPYDHECFMPALEEARRLHRQKRPKEPTNLLNERDWRVKPPLVLAERILSGRVLGIGPEARTDAQMGDHVRWGYFNQHMRVLVAGVIRLLVKDEYLEAVLT